MFFLDFPFFDILFEVIGWKAFLLLVGVGCIVAAFVATSSTWGTVGLIAAGVASIVAAGLLIWRHGIHE
jgi:hypothetical protein